MLHKATMRLFLVNLGPKLYILGTDINKGFLLKLTIYNCYICNCIMLPSGDGKQGI